MRKLHPQYLLVTSCLSAAIMPSLAFANPQGGQVVAGAATITETGPQVDIHQTTQRAIIDWRSFDIAPNETTRFHQPNASSHTLNRVNSMSRSTIEGTIQANGNITIINPNGVFFSRGSTVDVGGLTATTADVRNDDFMAGKHEHVIAGNPDAEIRNEGNITVRDTGLAALVAPTVVNDGVITAKLGKVHLASGDTFVMDLGGDGHLQVAASQATLQRQLVQNSGMISADGGYVALTAAGARDVVDSLITNTGVIEAKSVGGQQGKVVLAGDKIRSDGTIDVSAATGKAGSVDVDGSHVGFTGTIKASGDTGGDVTVAASQLSQQATIDVRGAAQGGNVTVRATDRISESSLGKVLASSTHGKGGTIDVQVTGNNGTLFTSGTHDASGATEGGKVIISAKANTQLVDAHVKADGGIKAGEVLVGGGFQGKNADVVNSKKTLISATTELSASASHGGKGGTVVTWSDEQTRFYGTSKAIGGGLIEVSSKDALSISDGAVLNAGNPWGQAGQVLLDPKNIIIANGGTNSLIFDSFELNDPNINGTGYTLQTVLANGNIVVTDHTDSLGGTSAGAAYLFSGTTGALISAITGSANNDRVGIGGVTKLTNGNYVILSNNWSSSKGAATWGSSNFGVSGTVSASNSIVSNSNFSGLSGMSVTALTNGNYVVAMSGWNSSRGAVSFANGGSGTARTIDNTNSLTGTVTTQRVGSSILALSNGNYVSLASGNGGAATWGSGTAGVVGDVSAANSLVNGGTGAVGGTGMHSGIFEVGNGNYIVVSENWNDDAGAVTWGDGTTGVRGVLDGSNSLIGGAGDYLATGGVTILNNGNYVINSYNYGAGASEYYGAVTWGDGNAGVFGNVDGTNSLIGSNTNDTVGYGGIIALTNGNYVVNSYYYGGDMGAVTWGDGHSGTTFGVIHTGNSLIGNNGDYVGLADWGGVKALTNGHYVVASQNWGNYAGAVTWGDGDYGTVGNVSAFNSLVGIAWNTFLGRDGITALTNGHYVVTAWRWNGDRGAVTLADGWGSSFGSVDGTNSLVGANAGDKIGAEGVVELTNGNYVVSSKSWDGGKGAVTWVDGANGGVGMTVNAGNSITGSSNTDSVGSGGVTALTNGNYVVSSQYWNSDAGAVTWGDGTTGTTGVVSAGNSLVGGNANDRIGGGTITALTNGNYVVNSPNWNGYLGAVSWGHGITGTVGVVSNSNSLVGNGAGNAVGSGGVTALANGHYIINSASWGNNLGAITFGDGTQGTAGDNPNAANSIFGTNTGVTTSKIIYDPVSGRNLVQIDNRVYSASLGGNVLYGYQAANDLTFSPDFLTRTLNTGADVTLQASNDITINDDIIVNNAFGDGGMITLSAGRSILVNADIFSDNGNVSLTANAGLNGSTGVVDAYRDAGDAVITMANGTHINAGTGLLTMYMGNGFAQTHNAFGAMTLADVTANSMIISSNVASDIHVAGALTVNSATFGTLGELYIDAAQNLGAAGFRTRAADYHINADISGTGEWRFTSTGTQNITLGGAAGTTMLDSDELDHIQAGFNSLTFANTGNVNFETYANWRNAVNLTNAGNVNVNGAQTSTGSAAGLFFRVANTGAGAVANINGDINFSAGDGYIWLAAGDPGSVVNLGANLTSGYNGYLGVRVDRAVNLTGTAGETRTINTNLGRFLLGATGSISGGDKNLEIITNTLDLSGTMSATTGGILLSPFSTGQTLGIGDGGSENIIYSTAFINTLKTNFAHYTFGRSNTGNVTNHIAAWDDNVTFRTGGGFASTTAITADDGVSVQAGSDITIDHNISSTNGPISLHAGYNNMGDLYILDNASIDAGAGALSLRADSGTILLDATSNAPMTLAGTGLTVHSDLAFASPGVFAAERFILNSKTGTLSLNGLTTVRGAGDYRQNLALIGDQININDTLWFQGTGYLNINTYTAGRQISLAGATGGLELDANDLGNIFFNYGSGERQLTIGSSDFEQYTATPGRTSGDIVLGAHTWANGVSYLKFYTSGEIQIDGAQDLGSTYATIFHGDMDVNAAVTGGNLAFFYGKQGALFDIGGAAGTTILDSDELDYMSALANKYFSAEDATGITMQAYSNWRGNNNFGYGTNGAKTLTVAGAQAAAANGNLYFGIAGSNNQDLTINVNADISTASGSGELVFYAASTSNMNLGANLSSGIGGITLDRAVALTGAAGTTRTINAGTGALTLNNNGTTQWGSIAATNKHLNMVADDVALGGAVTSTTGNITFATATNGTAIGIGTSGAAFNIDDTELARINAGTGLLTFGSNTHTGAFDINTAHVFDEDVRFLTGDAGRMTLSSDLDAHKDITFANGTGSLYAAGDHSVTTDGGDITVGDIDGDLGGESITLEASAGAIHMNGVIGGANGIHDVTLTSRDAMTLREINGRNLFARTTGATSDITLTDVLTLSGSNTALELVSGDDIINSHGAGVFNLTGTGRFVTWSDDPLTDTGEEHFSGAATKRYNRNYGDAIEATGNIRNYSVNPTLTVTADGQQHTYGDTATAPTTYTLSGWHMAEDEAVHSMGGVFDFASSYVQGANAGTTYTISDNGSTLTSGLNYSISYDTGSFTVSKANLRVKAVDMNYTAGSGIPTVTFVFEPTDFKMGQNAATAGLIGTPTVSNINWNTVGAGTYAMNVGFGGLSSVNYSFSQLAPQGVLTVTGTAPTPTPTIPNLLPDTVRKVMNNAGILFAGTSPNATSGTNDNGSTNSGKRRNEDTNAGSVSQNVNIYDAQGGQMVASMLGTISIDPLVMQAFGLTYDAHTTSVQ